jgi:hypothetical protein
MESVFVSEQFTEEKEEKQCTVKCVLGDKRNFTHRMYIRQGIAWDTIQVAASSVGLK